MNLSRRRIDEIVKAVGKALDIDTDGPNGLSDAQFDACCKNVREILREGRNDADLGRNIMSLMRDTYRASLMNWQGVRAAEGNAESAAKAWLDGRMETAKKVYEGAKAQYDSAKKHRQLRYSLLLDALFAARQTASTEKNVDATLIFQEILDENSVS